MKLRLFGFSLSAMLLAAGAFFTGCTQTTTPGTPTAFTDTFRDMTGLTNGTVYHFLVTGTSVNTVITAVSSYASGTVRVFWTRGAGDTSNVTVDVNSSSGNAMTWAPAAFTSMKRITESNDNANNPSGLILGDPSTLASITGPQQLNIDLVLATISGAVPAISLQAADIIGGVSNGKQTDVNNFHRVTGGLANDMETTTASGSFPSGLGPNRFLDIPNHNYKDTSIVFYVKTAELPPHYARCEIVPQPTGSTTPGYLWGDSPTSKRFIDVNVSYQTTNNLGFVERPGVTRRATNTPRVGRGAVIH